TTEDAIYNKVLSYASTLEIAQYLCKRFSFNKYAVLRQRSVKTASRNGHYDIVKYLCENFTLTTEQVCEGMDSALHHACAQGHFKIVKYLCEHFQLTTVQVSYNNYDV